MPPLPPVPWALLQTRPRSHAGRAWALACLCGASACALAQDGRNAVGGRVHEVSLSAALSETALVSVRRGERVEEAVTQLTPTLRWSGYSGRVRGSVSYSADLRRFEGNNSARGDKDTLDNRLSANVRAELIDNAAFIDIAGSVGQQSLGNVDLTTAGSSFQTGGGRTEVSNLSVSPYLVGSLAGLASYELRYGFTASDGTDQGLSRRTSDNLSLGLRGGGGAFGWSLSGSSNRTDFAKRGGNRGERVVADLSFKPDVDWRFGVNAGQERSNVGTVAAQTYDNWGANALWQPSVRTKLDVAFNRRYFGDSYRVGAEYRSPRTVWRYSEARDVDNGNQFGGVGQPITLFQLYFEQFASREPDPALREALVLQFLAGIGRKPDEVLFGSVLNRGVSIQHRRDLSMAWSGLRTAFSLQAYSSDSRTLDGPNTGLASGSGGRSRVRGASASLSYRLTPTESLSASASMSRTPDGGVNGNDFKSASLSLSSQIGSRASGGLSARYSVGNGGFSPYREAALTATFNLRF